MNNKKATAYCPTQVIVIVGTSLASRKTQDFTLQDLSRTPQTTVQSRPKGNYKNPHY